MQTPSLCLPRFATMLQLIVANSSPSCYDVPELRLPCISRVYAAVCGLFESDQSCEISVTFCSTAVQPITELLRVAVVDELPADLLLPTSWFESRFVSSGQFLFCCIRPD